MESFINLYPVSKTLRFELKPIGKTLETFSRWIEELKEKEAIELKETGNLLAQDEHRAESYKKVKKILDEYHKWFITESLQNTKLNGLDVFYHNYMLPKKEDHEKKAFASCQDNLRKQIVNAFRQETGLFNKLSGKELFKDSKEEVALLKAIVPYFDNKTLENIGVKSNEGALLLIEEFKDFTTYFGGFHENRKNMYSDEAKSTAVAFRLIHENLPRFIDNKKVFEEKIMNSELKDKFPEILKELEQILQVNEIEEMFQLDYFNDTLIQNGIDVYNHLIGGYAEEGKKKIQGLNEHINLYNQIQKEKNKRIPRLKPLYKQILSDRETASFVIEAFENDGELLESLEKSYRLLQQEVFTPEGKEGLANLLAAIAESETHKIFLKNDLGLTEISQQIYESWSLIEEAWNKQYDNKQKKVTETETYVDNRKKAFKSIKSFSIAEVEEWVKALGNEKHKGKSVATYFKSLGKTDEKVSLIEQVENNYNIIKDLLNTPYPPSKDLAQQKDDVEKIKNYLDSLKALQRFIKPLLGSGEESDKDAHFYGEFTAFWDVLDKVTPLYNKVRNYMTKKPYSTEKFKLNFENSYFLNGWAQDYETKAGLIFLKDGNYFLAINNKKLDEKEKKQLKTNYEKNPAKRIILDFQKPDNKNIPRLFIRSKGDNFAPAVEKYNLPISDVIDIYDEGKFKTEYRKINEPEYLKSLHKLIDYFKLGFSKHESYKHYSFSWKKTHEYENIAQFYHDVEVSCYQVLDENINWDSLMEYVEQNKLYLFQIYNKDFSPNSKGTPNMHTLYWKMLFNPDNLKDVVYKLNGQAEVFYRKASIKKENKIVHKANDPIDNKNELNKKKQNTFEYDIVKDKRYTVDKFQFHVPITLNFKAEGLNNLNSKVNEYIKECDDLHIIGIDRGERHLLYLSLIDMKGNIVKQFSLNEIVNEHKGNTYRTNYHNLLDKREKEREKERESWKTIETIKELKEGYISQVVHKITQLMIEYNAIVVLEDLNFGFKRGRFKVEKQVYQKFEKMLIDKLNYLVDKKKEANESGGTLKAYQLTDSYADFMKYKKKQCGFLFYVPAWNTSKIDPTTGFVNLFDTHYVNVSKAQEFFSKFKSIRYNAANNYFEFEVTDYFSFSGKAEGTKQNWIICTHGTRIINFRNPEKNSQWDNKEVVITDEFKKLFEKHGIDYKNSSDLKGQIASQSEKAFFHNEKKDTKDPDGLLQLFKLALQMRNSFIKSEEDYLVSPVMNDEGEFFDSRKAQPNQPENADANGAYNIAMKGKWVVKQIRESEDLDKLKLAISNKEWLNFAQRS